MKTLENQLNVNTTLIRELGPEVAVLISAMVERSEILGSPFEFSSVEIGDTLKLARTKRRRVMKRLEDLRFVSVGREGVAHGYKYKVHTLEIEKFIESKTV